MLKKNSNKKNTAADDLLSSLLEDVDQFDSDSDEKLEIEPTVYDDGNKKTKNKKRDDLEIPSDFLMPGFEPEKPASMLALNGGDSESVASDDFWEQAEKMANKQVSFGELNESEEFKQLEKDGRRSIITYQGPEASNDFLDQVNAQLSPVHKSGVVNTASDSGGSSKKNKPEYEVSGKYEVKENRSLQGGNQATEVLREIRLEKPEFNDATVPISALEGMDIPQILGQLPAAPSATDSDRTIAVTQFAQKQNKMKGQAAEQAFDLSPRSSTNFNQDPDLGNDERIMLVTQKPAKGGNPSQVSIDASLAQAENLRMAQNRILDLEKEIERLRQENDEILTASEILRSKAEEYTVRISEMEKEASENKIDFKNEIALAKGNISYKESENQKLKLKVEELELRIKTDFKKIRIRERELENRLELIKAEKQAVVKSKDELLLELQRKNDQAKAEIDNYREKVQELNKSIENNQSQIKMTVRALRIALSHIEDKADSTVPTKKAN
ncbi:MAG: hypothetical protein JNL11_15270 [Bdellovibrionaceae bacterium]|nr:hypothetical protein [Pseudobdellovibrionaceae bacterium]